MKAYAASPSGRGRMNTRRLAKILEPVARQRALAPWGAMLVTEAVHYEASNRPLWSHNTYCKIYVIYTSCMLVGWRSSSFLALQRYVVRYSELELSRHTSNIILFSLLSTVEQATKLISSVLSNYATIRE